jgi:hypothetical protein
MACETEGRDFNKMQGFKDWHNENKFSKEYKGPVMLVKFNKFKAMETLSEMIPGEEYDILLASTGYPLKKIKHYSDVLTMMQCFAT